MVEQGRLLSNALFGIILCNCGEPEIHQVQILVQKRSTLMRHHLFPYSIFPNARLCVRNDHEPQGMETPSIPKDRGRDAYSRYQD